MAQSTTGKVAEERFARSDECKIDSAESARILLVWLDLRRRRHRLAASYKRKLSSTNRHVRLHTTVFVMRRDGSQSKMRIFRTPRLNEQVGAFVDHIEVE